MICLCNASIPLRGLPLLHMFTQWLSFADYHLPDWAGYISIVIFALAMWLLWRSHANLWQNWYISTELRDEHTLIIDGVFQFIRHPMYSAHWLLEITQALL
ncbi:isoprenylcysteine carboxylmethyltransferase family protein [Chloroflexota bacterium]